MKLYTHPLSPNARKVVMTAHLLDLPLELEVVDLFTGAQKRPEFLALNPNGKVPTLNDDGFVLWESDAIMQYLAAKRPGTTLFPEDVRTRADVVRWQCWALAHWLPAIQILVFENMFKPLLHMGDPDPAELRKGEEGVQRFAGVLDRTLAQREYLVENRLTFADISVATPLMYAAQGRVPIGDYANIKSWFARIEALPAWKKTAPPRMDAPKPAL